MASMIGRPLFADKMTTHRERLSYARVYVEIKVGSELPKFVEVTDMDGV